MNGFLKWWASNKVAANLLMIAIVIIGIFSYRSINRENFPSVAGYNVFITVSWLGADPTQVEEQVVLRIEEAIADLDGISEISARAVEGFGEVNLRAKANTDMTDFVNRIKNRVDGISTFTVDAFPPIVRRGTSQEQLMFISLAGPVDERTLADMAKQYRDEIAALPGATANIEIWGLRGEEVSIEVSEESLRRFGLTFDDVSRAISANSLNGSSGAVRTSDGAVNLAIRNLADTKTEFENIIIRQNRDGSVIRVRDVATVVDGFVDVNRFARRNGEESLLMVLFAPFDYDLVEVSKVVTKWVEEKQEELPDGATMEIIVDTKDFLEGNIRLVSNNALLGLILVLAVLALFLRPVVAFWVAAGIGISFLGAFIFMPVAGVTMNFLSLFGLLLVLGIIVDDALVVGESIHRQVERGKTGLAAATAGTQLVAKPVFFAVITTMIAFLPFVFLTSEASQFLKHLSFTIIFALAFSLIESFLILPAHLSHLKPENKESGFYKLQRGFSEGMVSFANWFYRPLAKLAVKFRYFTVIFFFGFLAFGTTLLTQGYIKASFMPNIEGTSLFMSIQPVEGTPYKRNLQIYDIVDRATTQLKKEMKEQNGGKEVIKSIYIQANDSQVFSWMDVAPADERVMKLQTMSERLEELIGEIPDAADMNFNFTFNSNWNGVVYGIEADNLEDLLLASEDMKAYLRSINGTYDISDSLTSGTEEIRLSLKPGAERFGLTLAEVNRQVRQAYYGQEVQRLPRNGDDVRVMVRYPKETRESLESLNAFRIRTSDGREVPLLAVAEVSFGPAIDRINRYARKRSATVSAEIRETADATAIKKAFNEEFIPAWQLRHPNVNPRERGGDREEQEFNSELGGLYLIALFAMYIVLAIGFSSYAQPILIMMAIPFAFMGAMYGHFIFGVPFALFSVFGIGAAAGVVINDNLVLIDYVNRLRREGVGAYTALIEAGVTRFRPIILTSVTTFVGLFPILLEQSFDAQFLRPAVVSLAFGVLFALFVTLFFVPALYGVGVDLRRFMVGLWTGNPQPKFMHGQSANNSEAPDLDAMIDQAADTVEDSTEKDLWADEFSQDAPPPRPAE